MRKELLCCSFELLPQVNVSHLDYFPNRNEVIDISKDLVGSKVTSKNEGVFLEQPSYKKLVLRILCTCVRNLIRSCLTNQYVISKYKHIKI